MGSFVEYARKIFCKTNIAYRTRTYVILIFLGNFAYVVYEWSL